MKRHFEVVGKTTDGRVVVGGLAKFYFESGLPLCFIFDKLREHNAMPSWPLLYKELRDNGIPHDRVIHLLSEHIFDSYGKDFRDEIIKKLQKGR